MIHHWDFFGPDAQKTAEHFQKHFSEFSKKLAILSSAEGFFSADTGHSCFWVSIPDAELSNETQKKLRPKRSLTESEHNELLEKIKQSV